MAGSVLHWGPLIALTIILGLSSSTIYIVSVGYPGLTAMQWVFMFVWAAIVVGILTSFFLAVYTGPGFVPRGWRPARREDESSMQFCAVCNGFKAPRAHHCHQCGGCSKKMDHHCPWINSCVGNDNHLYFTAFVSLVPIGCLQTFAVMLYYFLYYSTHNVLFRVHDDHRTAVVRTIIALFSCGLSLGVALAVGILGVIQIRGIILNRTDIETWILDKASLRKRATPFVFPYHVGVLRNIRQVLWNSWHRDGLTWDVVDGCDIYTLSREQLEQKALKRQASEVTRVVKRPDWCCGLTQGCRVLYDAPFFDPKLSVQADDHVLVTNYTTHWCYGEKGELVDGAFVAATPRARGWIPAKCLTRTKAEEPKKQK
eukprot:m.44631 g.44631  ORF g.44631 m.44631 type:complete len:370 (+) comp5835_c0_seq2:35-1144(+)